MKAQANGIEIEYESFGREGDPVILLVMGLGAQLTLWPEALCEKLMAKGYRVIRYDNRDVGLSTKLDAAGVPEMAEIFSGAAKPAYTLEDMAADGAGLLDALGIERAHIVGASMGGMIAQLIAANHPAKTLSLTSIMSTTGNPAVPPATPEAMAALTTRLPADASMEAMIDNSVKTLTIIGSPAHDYDTPEERARIKRGIERSLYPAGFARQMAAIVANGDRREKLKGVTAPTSVIHGEVDPLVNLEGGKDTAASIAGAELIVIPGMGHDLPPFVLDQVADAIAKTAGRVHA
jgi:pimeloyl-ACP methyl ester carboxylesterase